MGMSKDDGRGNNMAKSKSYDRQLLTAAAKGDSAGVTEALRQGAKLDAQDKNGKDAGDLAREHGHRDIEQLLDVELVHRADLAPQDQRLLIAAINGDTKALNRALKQGANVEVQYPNGHRPLMLSSEYGHHIIVKSLLAHGADLHAIHDATGYNPLMFACWWGHTKTVRVLLKAGALVNVTNKWGETALMIAAGWGHLDIVKILLHKGVQTELKRFDGQTARWLAEANSHFQIVRILCEAYFGRLPKLRIRKTTPAACPSCKTLPDHLHADLAQDEKLPDCAYQMEIVAGVQRNQLKKCPFCGTYYQFTSEHTYLVLGDEDDEWLTRLNTKQAINELTRWSKFMLWGSKQRVIEELQRLQSKPEPH
jgi:ankyrin repeat protein